MVKAKKKAPKPKRARARRAGMAMDQDAARYAALVQNPCNAPLAHPIYAGSEGGYLLRTESFFTLGSDGTPGPSTTAHVVHWTPGGANTLGTELILMSAADGSTATTLGTVANIKTPGRDFLTNSVSVYRCVAACARVGYSGSEQTRAGRVHSGRTIGGLLDSGASVTADGVANSLPNYIRMPPTEMEILWTPADADQLFVDPNAAAAQPDRQRRGAITLAFSAAPALDNVVTIRLTAVYEWQPKQSSGLAVAYESRARSRFTLDQVINALGPTVTAIRTAGGFIGRMAELYGMQPSYPLVSHPRIEL